MKKTPEKAQCDWELIERDYRVGTMTLRQIATKHGLKSATSIHKRAQALGWTKDLKALVRAEAESIVQKEVNKKSAAVNKSGEQKKTCSPHNEREIITANAQVVADVILAHRKDTPRIRELAMRMLGELEEMSTIGESLKGQIEAGDALGAVDRILALPARTRMLTEMVTAFGRLVELERKVFSIDDTNSKQDAPLEKYQSMSLVELQGEFVRLGGLAFSGRLQITQMEEGCR